MLKRCEKLLLYGSLIGEIEGKVRRLIFCD